MKKMIIPTLVSLMIASSSLSAWTHPDPGSFSIEGQLLYLIGGTRVRPFYVQTSSSVGVTFTQQYNFKANNPEFRPAFSLEGIYAFCEGQNDLRARFTYFDASHTIHASATTPSTLNTLIYGNNSIATGNIDGRDKLHTAYYDIDVVLGQETLGSYEQSLTFLFGIDYSHINMKNSINFTGSDGSPNDIIAREKIWGIGPEIGIDFHYYPFLCELPGFSVGGNFKFAALVSDEKFHIVRDTSSSITLISWEGEWFVMPKMDIRVGVNYEFCVGERRANIELGFSDIWLYQALHDPYLISKNTGAYNFYGPYGSIGMNF